MSSFVERWRKFCLGGNGLHEDGYRERLGDVLVRTPALERLHLRLPVMMLGRGRSAATTLLAITLFCVAKRRLIIEHFVPLTTFALDQLCHESLFAICQNPMDLANCRLIFSSLRNLSISFQDISTAHDLGPRFDEHFWQLLDHAQELETLSMNGGQGVKPKPRDYTPARNSAVLSAESWATDSLNLSPKMKLDSRSYSNLRCLELRNVKTWSDDLVRLLYHCAERLEELYLLDVLLKHTSFEGENSNSPLWIKSDKPRAMIEGAPERDEEESDPPGVAEALAMACSSTGRHVNLKVLKATGLGYDVASLNGHDAQVATQTVYPGDNDGSFDQKFVESCRWMYSQRGEGHMHTVVGTPGAVAFSISTPSNSGDEAAKNDATFHQKLHRNPCSSWLDSIGGTFHDDSRGTKKWIEELIEVTGKCYDAVSAEVAHLHDLQSLDGFTASS